MVRVAEDDLGLHVIAQLAEMNSLHAAAGSYGHEDRGLYRAVRGGKQACTGIAAGVGVGYVECHFSSVASIVRLMELLTGSSVRAKSHTSCTFST